MVLDFVKQFLRLFMLNLSSLAAGAAEKNSSHQTHERVFFISSHFFSISSISFFLLFLFSSFSSFSFFLLFFPSLSFPAIIIRPSEVPEDKFLEE